jgi:hypothetical protein
MEIDLDTFNFRGCGCGCWIRFIVSKKKKKTAAARVGVHPRASMQCNSSGDRMVHARQSRARTDRQVQHLSQVFLKKPETNICM